MDGDQRMRRNPRRPDPDEDDDLIASARVRITVAPLQWLARPDVGRELDDPRYRRRLAAQAATLEAAYLPECCD